MCISLKTYYDNITDEVVTAYKMFYAYPNGELYSAFYGATFNSISDEWKYPLNTWIHNKSYCCDDVTDKDGFYSFQKLEDAKLIQRYPYLWNLCDPDRNVIYEVKIRKVLCEGFLTDRNECRYKSFISKEIMVVGDKL